jgi:acyl carrier protein
MNEQEIIQTINDFIESEFEVDQDKLIPSANLKTTLELDSLDYVDLVVATEKNLHIKVDPTDFVSIHTLQDFYDYVIGRL